MTLTKNGDVVSAISDTIIVVIIVDGASTEEEGGTSLGLPTDGVGGGVVEAGFGCSC